MAIITLSRPTGAAVAEQVVATRTLWSASWTVQPDLHCLRLSAATGETLSTAEFRYRCGEVITAGQTSFTTKPVVTINPLSYVLVLMLGSGGRAGFEWAGVWKSAVKHDTSQTFSAVGLEALLDNPCLDAPYWDGTSVRSAGRGLRFNARGLPNRSADRKTVNGQSVYVWDEGLIGTEYWSTRTAVETLLAMAAPLDATGAPIWNWVPVNLAALPDFDQLVNEPTHGTSYLNLLRALVPRHRLIGWNCRLSGTTVQIAFDTFASSAINLTDVHGNPVGTIPANSSQDAIVITTDQSSVCSLSTEASHVADQVIATGARRQSVFSLSGADGNLGGMWSSADETKYVQGATLALDYPSADEPRLQDERNRQARAAEQLRHVFARFGPPSTWSQTAGDGEGNLDPPDRVPIAVEDEDADPLVQFPLVSAELEFCERLPLLSGYAYDEDKILDTEDDPGHHGEETGTDHEPLPTLVFVRVVDAADDPSGIDRWSLIDQVARVADLEQLRDQKHRRWSADVRSLRGSLGLELRVQGEAQHVLAAAEMAGQVGEITGAIDWESDLIVTVCVEDLRDTEVRYPADEDVVCYGELVRRIRIEAPQYQLVRVLPNTVVAVKPTDQTLERTNGGLLIDDRPQLRILAQRTYEWHRQPRYALQLATGWVDGAFGVGHLITSLTDASGTYPVNSVVTEITIEFPVSQSAQSPRPTMTIATAFAEMDAAAVGRL